jgi:hypothetical protein
MDFNGEGYKKFNASPWASDVGGLNAIKSAVDDLEASGASEEQIKVAKTLLNSLQKLGLVSPDGKSQVEKVLSSGVAFVAIRKEQEVPLDLGVFLRAASGVSIADRVATLKQIVSDAGLKATDQTIGGVQGFVAEPTQPGEDAVDVKLYVAGTADKLGFAFSKSALEGLFGTATTSGLANIRALPEFAKAEDAVRSPEAPLSFGFASLKLMEPLFDQPQEVDNDFSMKHNPVAAVAFGQGYSTQMVTTAGLVVSPTNDVQKNVFTAFEGSGLPATAFKLPPDTAVSFSLDARILGKLETVLKGLDDPSASMALQQIKNIDGITLGVRNGDGTTPLPDIYLTLDSSTREQVASSLEMGIGLGMMATGQQPQWLSKDISGNPTRYFLTPIGLGVYVSSPKNSKSLIVASSERAVKDISTSEVSGGASLDTAMSRSLRDRVPSATSFGSLYLNFMQLGNLLDSVKGTVSSMVGPNPELDQALDSTRLKKLGVGIGNLSYANGVFKIQSVVERMEAR